MDIKLVLIIILLLSDLVLLFLILQLKRSRKKLKAALDEQHSKTKIPDPVLIRDSVHSIKSSINTITSFTQVLSIKTENNPEYGEYLSRILHSSMQILYFLNRIIPISYKTGINYSVIQPVTELPKIDDIAGLLDKLQSRQLFELTRAARNLDLELSYIIIDEITRSHEEVGSVLKLLVRNYRFDLLQFALERRKNNAQ